jgi:hypothetical protein
VGQPQLLAAPRKALFVAEREKIANLLDLHQYVRDYRAARSIAPETNGDVIPTPSAST